jgi:hypothetical protein
MKKLFCVLLLLAWPVQAGEFGMSDLWYKTWVITGAGSGAGGLTFRAPARHQFAYTDWNAEGKATAPFHITNGIFHASNGTVGAWSIQIARP